MDKCQIYFLKSCNFNTFILNFCQKIKKVEIQ